MTADAIIVGAGIVGSSIAWRLAQRGVAVTLLDCGRLGGEASWAAAGMLAPGGEAHQWTPWLDLAQASLRLYPAYVAELAESSRLPIDFQRRGAIELARTPEELEALEGRAAQQAGIGIRSEPIPPAEAGLRIAALEGARFYPDDALVSPRDIVRALRVVCAPSIWEGVSVKSIEAASGGVKVETSAGTLDGGVAVLAAGAWSSSIGVRVCGRPWTGPEVYPVRGHLFSCELPTGTLGPIVRHGHTYLLQRSSGLAIVGASSEERGFDRRVDPEIVAELRDAAASLLPAIGRAEMVERWLGFRPAAREGAPAIGRVLDSPLFVAYGHYRNGILLAPVTAERVASEIVA